ncbi:MAG: diguanylate cyclase, partial [Gammaproteobacteria bacterium]|nr:diguanylate cyclase [Gammaproteobacteria bacterium]
MIRLLTRLASRLLPLLLPGLLLAPLGALAEAPPGPAPLVISQDHAWPPLAYRDRQGEPQGLLVDLWRRLGEELGRPVEFRLADWPQSIEQLRDGRAMVHGGLFPSPERSAFLDFSRPLLPMEAVVFVATETGATALDDPGIGPVGVIAGSYEREFLQGRYADLPLRDYPNNDALVTAAVAGEVRAFAADYPVGRYLLDRHATPDAFHVIEVLYAQQLVAAVPKGEAALLAEIDRAIAALPPEELARIIHRWTHTETVEVAPRWLLPLVAATVLGLLLLFLGAHLRGLQTQRARLEQHLLSRTRELRERGAQFRALFDNSAVAVMVHDPYTARVLEANQRALQTYGVADVAALNAAAFEDESVWSDPPYALTDVERWFARTREEGPQRFEWLTRRINGELLWEDVFLQQVAIGGEPRIVSSSIDITARKLAKLRDQHRSEILAALVANEPLEALLRRIVRSIEDEDPESICSILLIDPQGGNLHHGAAPSLPADYRAAIDGLPVRADVGSCGAAAAIGRRVVVEDVLSHPNWTGYQDAARAANLRACWSEPILSTGGLVLGTFAIYHREPRTPGPDDLDRLRVAVDLASLAIERKQTETLLQRQASLEELVRGISLALLAGEARDTDAALADAMARIGAFMQASRCVLLELTPQGDLQLREQWCAPGIPPRGPGFQVPAGGVRPYLDSLNRGEFVILADDERTRPLERDLLRAGGTGSILALPMLRDGRLQSVLVLAAVEADHLWPVADIKLLQVAADLIGGALARQRLEQELAHQATHDLLTGLYNRRKLESLLELEIGRAQRYGRSFSLALLDIDGFKAINDAHGHDMGDAVLRRLGDVFRERLRDSDLTGRWGGEEFVVLLPETDPPGALQVAETLRGAIAATAFAPVGQVTISLGVA